jgi:predicted nucleotidyltransferase component of viral defense system
MTTVLTPLQNSFLNEFFDLTTDFWLTGGTALSAFYLQHRYSEDLDLFTDQEDSFQSVELPVKAICQKLNVEYLPIKVTSFFKHFQIGTIQTPLTLHFAKDYTPHTKPPTVVNKIIVESICDITTNKICAALGRTEIKDLIDLYFLDQADYTIADNFEIAQQKDGGLTFESLAFTLSQFSISEIPANMIKPITVLELERFLESTIEWLIRKSTPP